MSEWLLRQLDQAPGTLKSDPPEFQSAGGGDNICVFYLAHSPDPLARQEIITTLRTVADVTKVFGYSPLNAIAVRGSAAQIALVKELVPALDKRTPISTSDVPQFAVGGTPDLVRVYYISHATTMQDINRILVALRTTGGINKTFASSAKGAVVVRCRPEQMAKAEAIVLSMDQQLAR